jgi:hypothetical protein
VNPRRSLRNLDARVNHPVRGLRTVRADPNERGSDDPILLGIDASTLEI